ncbi:recombinase family protein [Chryseobacterium limigenitum]|uniref:Resolvase, N terminal domain n=1 Tax=Chryseobacterium limigenitum TaxID=1612149 RepID=A0A1K2ISR3_9FLAO|nr:hypothetical protein [Chryseobacterium limigenitum]SFZ95298.1 hypothetical protein SAMN05216324_10950 [Chryseobacterium limigenitum]
MLKSKKAPKRNPSLNRDELKYVIYCRKSREESGDGQKQSLLDQLKVCMDYAKQKNIRIENHNELTDKFFRDESYHRRESGCKGTYEESVLQEAKGFFYIVEQKSAKTPNNRPQRTQLIELVRKGKIK